VAGGLLYILMHGIAKGGLFLCAGIVEQKMHTRDITRLGGLMGEMPVTAASFLLCAFSVMGIPPFGGFFSKYQVFAGAAEGGNVWIILTFMVGAFMTLIYLFRLFNAVFLGEAKTLPQKEGSPAMVFSVAFLALLSLAGGIFVAFPSGLVRRAVEQMMGMMM
jgi:formate hydrogenlyase subunit 3/multisubunit Na+/H+ antiporter MnhD subunit